MKCLDSGCLPVPSRHPVLTGAWLRRRHWAAEREEGEEGRRAGRGGGSWQNNDRPACGLCPERSELTLSCHQTFQSPAWEPEEKVGEPNTYCFFCSGCQVWWDELAICSPSFDLASRKPLLSGLPLSISCSQQGRERLGAVPSL